MTQFAQLSFWIQDLILLEAIICLLVIESLPLLVFSSTQSVSPQSNPSEFSESFLNFFHTQVQTSSQSASVRELLEEFPNRQQAPINANVLEFWQSNLFDISKLANLAQIVLATPCTQVSVERSFSALALVLSQKHFNLSPLNLRNILIIKLNSEYFDKIEFDCEYIIDCSENSSEKGSDID